MSRRLSLLDGLNDPVLNDPLTSLSADAVRVCFWTARRLHGSPRELVEATYDGKGAAFSPRR
jgi:hypothetical protein